MSSLFNSQGQRGAPSPSAQGGQRSVSPSQFYNPSGAPLPFLPGNSFGDPRKLHHGRRTTLGFSATGDKLVSVHAAVPPSDSAMDSGPLTSPLLLAHGPSPLASIGRSASRASRPDASISSTQALNDGGVLAFLAYAIEKIQDSTLEKERVRLYKIILHPEDGTLEMLEKKDKNSGFGLGSSFLKRHAPQFKLEPSLFNVGQTVEVYGRRYVVYAMTDTARQYLEDNGVASKPNEEPPKDLYTERREREDKHSGIKGLGYRNDEFKRFAEGQLGFPSHLLEGDSLKQFLHNDRKVLRFLASWDNRQQMFGELGYYIVLYFLADDSVQILAIETSGGMPRILTKRGKVPHPVKGRGQYLSPEDFRVGSCVHVYSRPLFLHDCDGFTRRWFKENCGMSDEDLAPVFPEDEDASQIEAQFREATSAADAPIAGAGNVQRVGGMIIPPHNGIGRPEDTIQNVLRLVPKAPRNDEAKMLENDRKILRFRARFAVDENAAWNPQLDVEDQLDREFCISFFMADDTLSIVEQKQRNSGRPGGTFLRRMQVPSVRNVVDLFGGDPSKVLQFPSVLRVFGNAFELLECDGQTRGLIEEQFRPRATTPSSAAAQPVDRRKMDLLHRQVQDKLYQVAGGLGSMFRTIDQDHDGLITLDEFERLMRRFDFRLTDRELVALMERFDLNRDGVIDYAEFVEGASMNPQKFVAPSERQQQQQSPSGGDMSADRPIDSQTEEYIEALMHAEEGKEVLRVVKDVVKALRHTVFTRRIRFTESLYKTFDFDRDGLITIESFFEGLRKTLCIDTDKIAPNTKQALTNYIFGVPNKPHLDYRTFLTRIQYYEGRLDAEGANGPVLLGSQEASSPSSASEKSSALTRPQMQLVHVGASIASAARVPSRFAGRPAPRR